MVALARISEIFINSSYKWTGQLACRFLSKSLARNSQFVAYSTSPPPPPKRPHEPLKFSEKPPPNEPLNPQSSNGNDKFHILQPLLPIILLLLLNRKYKKSKISFQEFVSYVMQNEVESITILNNKYGVAKLTNPSDPESPFIEFTFASIYQFDHEMHRLFKENEVDEIPIKYKSVIAPSTLLESSLPVLFIIGGLFYLTKQGFKGSNMLNFGKVNAKKFNFETNIRTKFSSIKGIDEAKREIVEFVEYLRHPEKFTELGAKIPRGAVLYGPPGTGKTMLARATAGEAGVPFYSIAGSEFVEMFVGVGASRVRDLFALARENAPSIVFIDEIDAIGRSRAKSNNLGSSNDERESTLNQILVEMDGFDTSDQVVVLAGTNRLEMLDKALIRPGRLSRKIELSLPDFEGRASIFMEYLDQIELDPDLDLEDLAKRLAKLSSQSSGADIKQIVNEAALQAVREDCEVVQFGHFETALERQGFGLVNKAKMSDLESKNRVAYIESARAVVNYLLTRETPLKMTIIPRGDHLGYTHFVPKDNMLATNKDILNSIKTVVAGRIIEQLKFQDVSSRTANEYQKASFIAMKMVSEFGMSNLGPLKALKLTSNKSKQDIEEEITRIVDQCRLATEELIARNLPSIEKLANLLLQRENITNEDIEPILRGI